MPPDRPLLSRRTTLVVAPLATLAACEWGPDRQAPAAGPAEPPGPDDRDGERVAEALAAITATADLVARAAAEHRRLARPLADLTAMHLAHNRLLQEGAEPVEPLGTQEPVPATPRRAIAAVVREERRLQETLARLAVRVSSGRLARALASMSASVAQHVTVLPDLGGDGS